MSSRYHIWLAGSILGLTLAAVSVLLLDPWWAAGAAERSARFQRGVGGLGFGPAVDLSQCEFAFDPRLESACTASLGPIPGGAGPCRCHPSAAFSYPPLTCEAGQPLKESHDAPLP